MDEPHGTTSSTVPAVDRSRRRRGRRRARQAWSTLGSRVTIVEGGSALLGREEEFAAKYVQDGLVAARGRRPRRRAGDRGRAQRRGLGPTLENGHGARRRRDPRRRRPPPRDDASSVWRPSGSSRDRTSTSTSSYAFPARLALCDRRHQRPRAPHAHGEVPGPRRRRRDPRPDARVDPRATACYRRVSFSPSPGRRRRAHARVGEGGGARRACRGFRDLGTAGGSFYGRSAPGNVAPRRRRAAARARRRDVLR